MTSMHLQIMYCDTETVPLNAVNVSLVARLLSEALQT